MTRFPELSRKLSRRSRRNKTSIDMSQDMVEIIESSEEYPTISRNTTDPKLASCFNFISPASQPLEAVISNSSEVDERTFSNESIHQPDWSLPRTTKRNSFASTRLSLIHAHSRHRSMVEWSIHDVRRKDLGEMMCDAASTGDVPQIGRLLGAGADARRKSKDGTSPLHLAAAGGHLGVLKSLIIHGAKVDVTDSNGRTALHVAVLNRQSSVIPLLVSSGVPLDAKDSEGCTAINLAARQSAEETLLDPVVEPSQNEKVRFSYVFGTPSSDRRASISSTGSNSHSSPLETLLRLAITDKTTMDDDVTAPVDVSAQASELRNAAVL